MLLTGYCSVQKKKTTISVQTIPSPTLEDRDRYLIGRITCDYASFGGNCDCKNVQCFLKIEWSNSFNGLPFGGSFFIKETTPFISASDG